MLEAFKAVTTLEGIEVVIGENDDVIPVDYQKTFCKQHNSKWITQNWGHRVEDVGVLGELIQESVTENND
ncbi:MAG: hypothetical protein ISEC1_P1212 [Thiomicrorhabdus sp.]|nr:MAG: hypothetical protein ISEC1_P1212 [Thiomicrorhabdus sp.]